MTPFNDVLRQLSKKKQGELLWACVDLDDFVRRLKIIAEKFDAHHAAKNLHLLFIPEEEAEGEVCYANSPDLRDDFRTSFIPKDLLDYFYALIFSRHYREKFWLNSEINHLQFHYPEDVDVFWKLVRLGGELRQYHLLEHPKLIRLVSKYPISGERNNWQYIIEENIDFEWIGQEREFGRIRLNENYFIDHVPKRAWDFNMGGYQPVKRWLEDRKHTTLTRDDVWHYQKIIAAIEESLRLMKEIDKNEIE